MKKMLWRIVFVVVVLLIVAVLAVVLSLDRIVKTGIETVGPKLTKVPVTVDSVHISLLGGSGNINQFVVGNPEGFNATNAISIGKLHLSLKAGSIFSDKVVIKSIEITNPDITLEQTLHGNNLKTILNNVEGNGTAATNSTTPSETSAKKIEVDDFLISGAKVHVMVQGYGGTVTIPTIHLTNLGTSEGGITAGDLVKRVLQEVVSEAVKAAGNVSKGALKEEAGKALENTKSKVSEGLNNLLKKK